MKALLLLSCSFMAFPVLWCGLSWLIGLGGWRALSKVYPDRAPKRARSYFLESVRVGASDYKALLMIDVGTDGVRFAVFPVFRIGHPPFFVPWEELLATPIEHWLVPGAELGTMGAPVNIQVKGQSARRILRQARVHRLTTVTPTELAAELEAALRGIGMLVEPLTATLTDRSRRWTEEELQAAVAELDRTRKGRPNLVGDGTDAALAEIQEALQARCSPAPPSAAAPPLTGRTATRGA